MMYYLQSVLLNLLIVSRLRMYDFESMANVNYNVLVTPQNVGRIDHVSMRLWVFGGKPKKWPVRDRVQTVLTRSNNGQVS